MVPEHRKADIAKPASDRSPISLSIRLMTIASTLRKLYRPILFSWNPAIFGRYAAISCLLRRPNNPYKPE
jgi:hypothetical protein